MKSSTKDKLSALFTQRQLLDRRQEDEALKLFVVAERCCEEAAYAADRADLQDAKKAALEARETLHQAVIAAARKK